ncbi:heme lyase CcmF/NrfE family subunit [Marinithermus hydrothermalis]|uniref:Cytochrome c assembly protein n=1 Tax=Marinithermus hydrothermalis (strain DSM 14884 / JCM 11576 / T1) TaxID=869210 RepID=F2NMW5_MARHT|nr:heme lyase CcmF/NrfE family subunit [Marinithermus hydrothermalis]AEB12704.1 cytochrome c assembly protein [Marinithermus hydrothermalis DSM 14884]
MTPGAVGNLALLVALLFTVAGLVLSGLGWYTRDVRYVRMARRAAGLVFLGALAAFLALEWALLTDDFSITYTARTHSVKSPTWVKIATLWAALEGSLLLWGMLQALYTFLAARRLKDYWMAPVALGTLFAIQGFFFGVLLFVENPFTPVPNPPTDGPGPNPLLQNHWMMAVHPVLMYLGFVGLSVPFAYAVAAMVSRRYQSWVRETKWWTLIAWGFLTAAIFAGGWWSYEVLGWGGYWAWDPVENASFIPWLLATAFVHTAMVQERRGLLRGWNFGLITLTFAGTVFGTFLTRSGVIQSVHAFASGPIGPIFLGFFLVVLAVGFMLLSRISSEVRDAGSVRLVSREGALFASAVVFATMAFVVVLGTLFPLLVEATRGLKVSVGAPFFNQIFIPLGAMMLLLMGIGPVLPWKRTQSEVLRNLAWILGVLVLGFLGGLAVGWTVGVSLAVGLFAYNVAAIVLMVAEGVRTRARSTGEAWAVALVRQATQARRRYGSHVVHFGVALAALAIAFSQAYRVDAQKTLRVGETWEVLDTRITLLGVRAQDEGNRFAVLAPLELEGIGRLEPRLHYYPTRRGPLAAPDVGYTLGRDYYLTLQAFDEENGAWATLRLVVTPMVLWLWVAGALILLGTMYILWPSGQRFTASIPTATGGGRV